MKQSEVNKLFELLLALYPHAANAGGEQTRIAWYMALKDYTYEELKETALRYAREKKYFPQLSELLAYMPYDKAAPIWIKPYLVSPKKARQMAGAAMQGGKN